MDKKLRLLESFSAHGSDGLTYGVRGYEHLAAVALHAGEPESWESTGLAEYKLADGGHITVDNNGEMQIAHSGVRLRRV